MSDIIIETDNCFICAEEYDKDDLYTISFAGYKIAKTKICKNCLNDNTDGAEKDFQAVKKFIAELISFKKD